MKKKDSPICDFCPNKQDSNERMLVECTSVQKIWREVEGWVSEIGAVEYSISEEVIIYGELQKAHW